MKQILILLLLSILTVQNAASQITIQVIDEDNKAIEGVYAMVKTSQRSISYVTDETGKIQLAVDIALPAKILLKHTSYKSVEVPISNTKNQIIRLKAMYHNIDDVVITGDITPRPSSQSLYNIRSISQQRIQAQGALKLNEVLSNELGIQLSRDPALGATTMQLLGIGGQNVKILIDGVPLVGRLGNSIDLEQINTNNIQKIEIVEGPMGVLYGTDALAGVINIITKKTQEEKLNVTLSLQEETAGKEYSLTKDGIHNQAIDIGYRWHPNWLAKMDLARNYSNGFKGEHIGRAVFWKPKTQNLAGALLRYQKANIDIHYRIDYLNESIMTLGDIDSLTFKALDQEYIVHRYINTIKAKAPIFKKWTSLQYSIAYSDYQRYKRSFVKDLETLQETLTKGSTDQDTSAFDDLNIRLTLGQFQPLNDTKWALRIGTEIDLDRAKGTRIKDHSQKMQDYALFASLTYHPFDHLTLQPALRWAKNSTYNTPLIPSIRMRYGIGKDWSIKASYGLGFRAPSLKELYFEFVDANHNVIGNKDLMPEQSNHLDLHINRNHSTPKAQFVSTIQTFYNDMTDLIGLASNADVPGQYHYINIDTYKTLGFSFRQQVNYQRIFAKIGLSYIGRYQTLSEDFDQVEPFLFAPEVNTQLSYHLPKLKTDISVFYKYIGQRQAYQLVKDKITKTKIDPYHWMDASIAHHLSKALEIRLGAKNLINVKDINTSIQNTDVHGGESGSRTVAYGRSYFLKLSYRLGIK